MRDSYHVWVWEPPSLRKRAVPVFYLLVAAIAAAASFTVFLACLYWFRHDQRKQQRRLIEALTQAEPSASREIFVAGDEAMTCGELVAQFKVRQGKQVVSVLEADGKRFIHIEGDLSANERARMIRYLKSEGFMS